MNLDNHHKEAERHWGMAWTMTGGVKPAGDVWIAGVKAARTGSTTDAVGTKIQADGVTRVQAEAADERASGGIQADSTASGGERWNQWSNGEIAHTFEFEQAGTYDLRVQARGDLAEGIEPHMEIRLDGTLVASADPTADPWQTYSVPVEVAAGTHRVQVAFTNDARTETEDRNLLLDWIEWEPAVVLTGIPVSSTSWTIVEAELFSQRSNGGVQNDASASGGKRWNQWSNGASGETFGIQADGDYEVRVWAAGEEMDGVPPHMELRWDGVLVLAASPPAGPWQAYAFTVTAPQADHGLEVRFTNGALSETEDRNLLVDYVEIGPVAPSAGPGPHRNPSPSPSRHRSPSPRRTIRPPPRSE
jgi:hypothetical protein